MILAIVVLAFLLVAAVSLLARGALDRRFARITAFEQVWRGDAPIEERTRPLDFSAWVARFGRSWLS